jgi:hypothetical protein
MVTLTDRARDALLGSLAAALRFDPNACLRVVRRDGALRVVFAEAPDPGDQVVSLGETSIGFEAGITGTIDAGEHNALAVVAP